MTVAAEVDLEEAALWYEQRSTGLGIDLVAKVRDTLARLSSNPELYLKVYLDIRRAPVHRFPYGVFYRVRDHICVGKQAIAPPVRQMSP